jgi:spermidine synthase
MKGIKKYRIILLAGSFLAGFTLMVIELLAVRIMAPIVGASVFTWTSAIGVMLLGLSIGSYVGGRVVDKFPQKSTLGISFLASSLAVSVVPLSVYISSSFLGIVLGIFSLNLLLSLALFFVPALFLGTIQPIIVKLYADNHKTLGEEYGLLSALWSAGSILGVFLTGFYLVSHFGVLSIIYSMAAALFIPGCVFFYQNKGERTRGASNIFLALVLALILSVMGYNILLSSHKESVIYEKNSAYYHIKVIDAPFRQAGLSRFLFLDADAHSIEPKTGKKSLLYTDIYPIFSTMKDIIRTIHVIGGGAYTLPKEFMSHYQDSSVSVSEIDPDVEKIAKEYFGLDSSVIHTDHNDPRYSFRLSDTSYDLIFGDAYNSFVSVPGHLLTYEFNELAKKHLNPGGLYAINIASATKGKESLLFQSVYKTFIKTFPNTIVIAFSPDPMAMQNVILVGSTLSKPIDRAVVSRTLDTIFNQGGVAARILFEDELSSSKDGVFLTDNFAPVENLVLPAVEGYFRPYFDFYKKFLGKKLFLSY